MANIDVEAVLSQLTDREKVSLLAGVDFWHTKSFPQHGVPSLRLSDGPNGVRGTRFFNSIPAACFPCGTALGATFNTELLREAGRLMGEEAKAKGAHVLLGPTINMQRGPLGGRGFESFSEDPVLAGKAAAAVVSGIQEHGVAAALKHFVCNDQEHERNKVNSIVTERALREIYLLPFQIAVRDAQPRAMMTAYNKINGVHVAEDPKFLRRVLREEWGWKGMVVSDWFGTYSTTEAINAGLDLEMPGPTRWRGEAAYLAAATNKLHPTALDDCAREVLDLVKFCAASGIPENAPEGTRDTPETAALLRRLAAESVVLLKNSEQVLPLKKDKRCLVIGPNAASATYCGGGSAALSPYYAITPLEAIAGKLGADNVTYTVGAYSHRELPDLGPCLKTASADGSTGVRFTAYNDAPGVQGRQPVDELEFTTTAMMFMDYKNPRIESALWYADIEGFFAADRDGEFELGVCVYGAARLFVDDGLVLDVTERQVQGTAFLGCGTAEMKAAVPMRKGATYRLRLEFSSAPTSKLQPQGVVFGGGAVRIGGAWRIDPVAEIARAAELAAQHEQVVLCIGLNADWEGEGFDREHMGLPPRLDDLAAAVLAANPRTAVVMQSGTPVEMPWLAHASALLHAWYGGNETGNAIADVLFGDFSPSGKLPLSFPARNEHNPTFLNFRSEAGRVLYGEDVYVGYRWYEMLGQPVSFPFGFGLSYTTFEFRDLRLAVQADSLAVSVVATNTGPTDGAETVQIYVSQHVPSIRRPKKELKGFTKLFVPAGQSATATVDIPLNYACGYFDERKMKWIVEKGRYRVLASNSSAPVDGCSLQTDFTLDRTWWWTSI